MVIGNQDEQRLIALAQRGNVAAFEVLVTKHSQLVFNLALHTLGDTHEAEDVAQEAFVRAWRGLPRFQGQARFRTWLYRIVTNLCYNRLPQLKQDLSALEEDEAVSLPDSRQRVEATLINSELQAALLAAMDHLPESYRLLITLRHLQGMSYNEIAEVTSLPLGSVKTGIFRARQRLRETLAQFEEA